MNSLKKLASLSLLGSVFLLGGCATTDQYGRTVTVNEEGCERGTSYGGAALGAIAGGLLGSAVGSGSGRDIATVAGVAGGAYVGSRSDIGCENYNNRNYRNDRYHNNNNRHDDRYRDNRYHDNGYRR